MRPEILPLCVPCIPTRKRDVCMQFLNQLSLAQDLGLTKHVNVLWNFLQKISSLNDLILSYEILQGVALATEHVSPRTTRRLGTNIPANHQPEYCFSLPPTEK